MDYNCLRILELWNQQEEPTFVIPTEVSLTQQQQLALLDTGQQQGAPFIITSDGAIARSESKKFSIHIVGCPFSVKTDTIRIVTFENSDGNSGYLRFTYNAEVNCILKIYFYVKDRSTSSQIR